MRNVILIFILHVLILFSMEGSAQAIRGNEKLASSTRELSGFNEIIAQGKFNLMLTQGEKEGVLIEADENIMELFQTRIDGKTLYITMLADIKKYVALNVIVSIKELTQITLLKEVSLKTESVVHFDGLTIFSAGMSQLNLELFAASLTLKLNDATFGYLKGYAEKFYAEIHDETELNAFDMQTDKCSIVSTGLTEVMINVEKDLKLLVTGASNLYYTGNPVISQRIFSSSGFIVKRQRKN